MHDEKVFNILFGFVCVSVMPSGLLLSRVVDPCLWFANGSDVKQTAGIKLDLNACTVISNWWWFKPPQPQLWLQLHTLASQLHKTATVCISSIESSTPKLIHLNLDFLNIWEGSIAQIACTFLVLMATMGYFKSRYVLMTTVHTNATVLEMWYVMVVMVIVVKLDVTQDLIINTTDHLPVREWRKV